MHFTGLYLSPLNTHFIVSVSGFISVLFPDVVNFLSNFMEQAIVSKEHMDFFEGTTKAAIAERTIEDSVSRLVDMYKGLRALVRVFGLL